MTDEKKDDEQVGDEKVCQGERREESWGGGRNSFAWEGSPEVEASLASSWRLSILRHLRVSARSSGKHCASCVYYVPLESTLRVHTDVLNGK